MPFKDKAKYNEYQRNYKRKQAEELKAARLALAELQKCSSLSEKGTT